MADTRGSPRSRDAVVDESAWPQASIAARNLVPDGPRPKAPAPQYVSVDPELTCKKGWSVAGLLVSD